MPKSRFTLRPSRIARYVVLAAVVVLTLVTPHVSNCEPEAAPAQRAEQLKLALDATPKNPALATRYCELLTHQGRQTEAIEACRSALALTGSQASLRALIAALLHGGKRPNTTQLLEASIAIRGMRRTAPQAFYTVLAECDLLEGLGDWSAFADCSARLNQLDPQHEQTKRVSATLEAHRPKWYVSVCWWSLALAGFVVFGRFALRRFTIRHKSPVSAIAVLAALGLALVPRTAIGESSLPTAATEERPAERPEGAAPGQISRFAIDPNNPEASIPPDSEKNRDPLQFGYLLMDLTDRGESAIQSGDHQTAIRYYRALAKAVPNRSISFSKLCSEYQALGAREQALAHCRAALLLGGVKVEDFLRFSELVLGTPGTLSADLIREVDEVVKHLAIVDKDGPYSATVECKLGLRLKDPGRMHNCTQRLGILLPKDPQTISFEWAYALMRKDYNAAQSYVSDAKNVEMGPDAIQRMEYATEAAVPLSYRILEHGWMIATAVIVALFALAVFVATRQAWPVAR